MVEAPLLQAMELGKCFRRGTRRVQALRQVQVELRAGECVAVQGPSGSGKTTLLMLLAGLLRPTEGRVVWRGEEMTASSESKWNRFRRRHLGFVFQSFHLLPYLSVWDNVWLGGQGAAARAAAAHWLQVLQMSDRLSHYPPELSAGEQQRVALARALVSSPACILADEPTGNLDGEAAGHVLATLRRFVSQGGAVILVTHNDRVAEQCDRCLRLHQGQLVR